jgi:hypothetical protein
MPINHGLALGLGLGPHNERLAQALESLDSQWPHQRSWGQSVFAAWPDSPSEVAKVAAAALSTLDSAADHAAFLILAARAAEARVGQRVDVRESLTEWGLPADHAPELLRWIVQDPPHLNGDRVPVLADAATGSLYRTARTTWEKIYTTTAILWGTLLGLGTIVLAFALLKAAELTTWPPDWLPKLVVLYLCVVGGALAHIASRSLASIRFDDSMQIFAAAPGVDWLRLRWLAILRMLLPVVIVAGGLWGAGTVPTQFQDLGVAFLSGYCADSIFRAGLSKVQAQASARSK